MAVEAPRPRGYPQRGEVGRTRLGDNGLVNHRPTIGQFLRSRREAAQPDRLGVVSFGTRRVPGLRREELAMLAGVSTSYYTRIEQGHTNAASGEVLKALARALQLDEHETAYLLALAQAPVDRHRRRRREMADPDLVGLMEAMGEVGAVLVGRRMDVLAWTPLGHALLAPHYALGAPQASHRPNWARMVFTDPHLRELFVDWERKAWDVAGYLRLQAARFADDPALAALVGELCLSSSEFDERWGAQRVKDKTTTMCRLRHPMVGELDLVNVPLRSSEASDQLLGTFYAAAGSPSEVSLRLLRLSLGPDAALEAMASGEMAFEAPSLY